MKKKHPILARLQSKEIVSEDLLYAIAPQGHGRLTGGMTPGVREPSPFSLMRPEGVRVIPLAERLLPPTPSPAPLRGVPSSSSFKCAVDG